MARPKKPNAWKIISGSRRVERGPPEGVQIAPLEVAPPPPEWMYDRVAISEWQRLCRLLIANRMLTELDLGPLAHLCATHGRLRMAYHIGRHRAASLVPIYNALSGAFGLTPAARRKSAPSTTDKSGNRFHTHCQTTSGTGSH